MKIADSSQIRGLDRAAMEKYKIPGMVLMENAALGVVGHVAAFLDKLARQRIIVICGPGNNGGDGLAVARHLKNRGANMAIFHLADPDRYHGDAAANQAIVAAMGIESTTVRDENGLGKLTNAAAGADLIIDAIFGTGLTREVDGIFTAAITAINQAPAPVTAVDIPSGLNSDNGRIMGAAVRADLTVTFGLGKIGLHTGHGPDLCGGIEVVDISIPPAATRAAGIMTTLLDDNEVRAMIPRRPRDGHKGTFGHVFVVAGSRGKTGAGILAARGAMASGCGLVTIAVPWDLNPIFATTLSEAMTIPLPGSRDGRIETADLELIRTETAKRSAVVIGPGLGTEPDTAELVLNLVSDNEKPMIIDADGLNIIASAGKFKGNDNTVLTPHPGEMARLLDTETTAVQADRPQAARKFARMSGAVVLLKGAGTVIAHPDGRMAINPEGSPVLATGGSGDVLAGLIGGLMAQGTTAYDAACLGAYLHGLAARSLAHDRDRGATAGEICREISPMFTFLR